MVMARMTISDFSNRAFVSRVTGKLKLAFLILNRIILTAVLEANDKANGNIEAGTDAAQNNGLHEEDTTRLSIEDFRYTASGWPE